MNQHSVAPTGRILAFDFARGMALLFMVVIHTMHFYASSSVQTSWYGIAVQFAFGWPSASLFTFMMGVFIIYAKPCALRTRLYRGIQMILLGYMLNVVRATIPTALSLHFGLVSYEQLEKHTPMFELFVGDILQFAGMAYIVCTVIGRISTRPLFFVLVGVSIAFFSPMLWDSYAPSGLLGEMVKLFVGNKEQGALFPLFPWLSYPLFGMSYAAWIQDKGLVKGMSESWKLALLITVASMGLIMSDPAFHIADNLRSGPGLIFLLTGLVMLVVYVCYAFLPFAPVAPILKLFVFWSQHVTLVYCVHWLFIGWGLMVFGPSQLGLFPTLLLTLAIGLLTHVIVFAYRASQTRTSNRTMVCHRVR